MLATRSAASPPSSPPSVPPPAIRPTRRRAVLGSSPSFNMDQNHEMSTAPKMLMCR